MENLIRFLLDSFLVFRVSHLITSEEGPASIFQEFRNLFLNDDWIGRGVRCIYCVSFWIGLLMGLLQFGISWKAIRYGLAVSGAAILVHKL